jgi:hypothetical protein
MSDVQDIQAIMQLKARYFRYLDTQNWESLVTVFTPDAKVAFPEIDVVYDSGGAFVEFARNTMAGVVSVHQGYLPEIEIISADRARGIWAMTDDLDAPGGMPQSGGKPVRMRGAGHYHDEYVKLDGAWRISASTLHRLRLDVT